MSRSSFEDINRAALAGSVYPQALAARRAWPWPGVHGPQPQRNDRRPGSFKVNLRSGKWSDFATGDKGGDPISLAAYLHGLGQGEAARRLADMLGIQP